MGMVNDNDVRCNINITQLKHGQEEFLQVPVRKGKSKSNTLVDRLTQFMDRRMRATGSREFREQDLKAMAGNVETKDWDKVDFTLLHAATHCDEYIEEVLRCEITS